MKLSKMTIVPLFLLGAALAANAMAASSQWMLSEGSASVAVPTSGKSGHLAIRNTGPGQAALLLQKGDKTEVIQLRPDPRFLIFEVEAGTKVRIQDRPDSNDHGSAGSYTFVD